MTFTLFRAYAPLDKTLNDDDSLPNLMCAKRKWRVESLDNHTLAGLLVLHYSGLMYKTNFVI